MALFLDTAERILRESGKHLHCKDITNIAIEKGYLVSSGKTPYQTMAARISDDIKIKGELSVFKKFGPNIFGINDKKVELGEESRIDQILEELSVEEQKEVEGGYVGKAGEHAVLSELLFRGYNAALMSVDTGIDILAIKNEGQFGIQVKTRNISKTGNTFDFNLRVASFERHNRGGVFYIFLLRETPKIEYLILPFHVIERSIDEEFIHEVGKGKLYRITIRKKGSKVYLGRKENDVTYFLNRWDSIK
ncbi:MAG: winged helix-turn-helix domain-containing protein [Candidatus Paceibacterota bacterium]